MFPPKFSVAIGMLLAPGLFAQDIPLSKILVNGEGWKPIVKLDSEAIHLQGKPEGILEIFHPEVILALNLKTGERKQAPSALPDYAEVVKANQKAKPFENLRLASYCLWPDHGHLVIGEKAGGYLWAFRVEADGSLGPGDRYYSLRTQDNIRMHVAAMVMDAEYLLYAATPIGIQVFDPTGRLSGVIAAPAKEAMTALAIGGTEADTLFVACGDAIHGRKIQKKASYTLKK